MTRTWIRKKHHVTVHGVRRKSLTKPMSTRCHRLGLVRRTLEQTSAHASLGSCEMAGKKRIRCQFRVTTTQIYFHRDRLCIAFAHTSDCDELARPEILSVSFQANDIRSIQKSPQISGKSIAFGRATELLFILLIIQFHRDGSVIILRNEIIKLLQRPGLVGLSCSFLLSNKVRYRVGRGGFHLDLRN